MSFDLVRGVCVNGKARHQFVLGLGSQKSGVRYDTVGFWDRAIFRMTRHGIEPERRQRLIAEMVRKGARLPSPDEYQKYVENDRARGSTSFLLLCAVEYLLFLLGWHKVGRICRVSGTVSPAGLTGVRDPQHQR